MKPGGPQGRGASRTGARIGADVLATVRSGIGGVGPAERRLALTLLADPAGCAAKTISALAERASVSQATVVRYAKSLGLAGYPELRLSLAAAAAVRTGPDGTLAADSPLTGRDSLASIVARIGHADSTAVTETTAHLDLTALGTAVERLARAGRIDIYGFGGSAVVAADLQLKLHRIGRVSFLWVDHDNALHSAGLLTGRDVALGISHRGTTTATVDALARARERGAATIALTNAARSPVARAADVVLLTASRETDLRFGAVGSRAAALAVVDCLFVGVAQRNLAGARRALGATANPAGNGASGAAPRPGPRRSAGG